MKKLIPTTRRRPTFPILQGSVLSAMIVADWLMSLSKKLNESVAVPLWIILTFIIVAFVNMIVAILDGSVMVGVNYIIHDVNWLIERIW